jgi:hypothetical protein
LEVTKKFAVVPGDFAGPVEDGKGSAEPFPVPACGGGLSAGKFPYDREGERETVSAMQTQEGMGGARDFASGLAFECDHEIGVENQFHGLSGA